MDVNHGARFLVSPQVFSKNVFMIYYQELLTLRRKSALFLAANSGSKLVALRPLIGMQMSYFSFMTANRANQF